MSRSEFCLGLVLLAVLIHACGSQPQARDAVGRSEAAARRDSVILITLSGLRPDVVGALGAESSWTPQIDAFAREADWVGTAVVASSAPVVSLTSLMTGVSPWQHQVLSHEPATPRGGISLLSQELGRMGYRTSAHVPPEYKLERFGLFSGFDSVQEISPAGETRAALRGLGREPEFHWLHLREANVAYQRRDAYLPRLAARSAGLPEQMTSRRLLPYADPALLMPPAERATAWELFCHEVAWADQQVGELLAALHNSSVWEQSWIVLTATQGVELGEHGQVLYAENLGRETIEVPLMIKSPDSHQNSWTTSADQRVSQPRLWATLVEAVGGEVEPVHAPSLFQATDRAIVSELYLRNGINEFSLLEGDLQLIRSIRFAPEEPEFYLAQLAQSGGHPPLSEPARRIFERLRQAFRHSPPYSGPQGGHSPSLRLERWTERGTIEVEDPRLAADMATRLHHSWRRFVDRERTPQEESSLSAALR